MKLSLARMWWYKFHMAESFDPSKINILPSGLSAKRREIVLNAAADIRFINRMTGVAADQHDLRHCSTRMREFAKGELRNAWHFADFSDQPKVTCAVFVDGFSAALSIIGGAPFSHEAAGSRAIGLPYAEYDGSGIFDRSDIYKSEFISIGDNQPSNMGNPENICVNNVTLRLDDFWSSTCIVYGDIKISRQAVVNYIANARGSSHFGGCGVSMKHRIVYNALMKLHQEF